ncbi:MAG TPA: hypothetical protein VGS20_05420 [Candidatus Acidoferrales bacterium]|nr:hypothetical protein [Candidatus Acidoferrales bacterium]
MTLDSGFCAAHRDKMNISHRSPWMEKTPPAADVGFSAVDVEQIGYSEVIIEAGA